VLGTWQLGGAYRFGGKPDGLGAMSESTAHALLARAYRGGIRVFDTADIYGLGSVEPMLARLPGDTFVITKFGNRGTAEERGKDFSRTYLVECLERSTYRLARVPDLVLMHNPPLSFDFGRLASLELEALRRDALLEGFGVSCTSVAQACDAIEHDAVQAVEVNFNLLDRRARDSLFARATSLGKDVLSRAPYCSGFLTERFVERDHEFGVDDRRSTTQPEDRHWRVEAARRIACGLDTSGIAEIALRFALSFSELVVFGCRSVEQLETNLAYARKGPLDRVTLEAIEAIDLGSNPCW